jgi:uracil-DNA glycosylase family 4
VPSLRALDAVITRCRACPRLVAWREAAGDPPPRRYTGQTYWSRPVPGFGDPGARVLVVGLAPAAHGANRTGRIFTGDRSGDWLYAALHRAGLASQPTSIARDDGLALRDAYVTCVVRCAPPDNAPAPDERDRCVPYLARELELLRRVRAVVALGAFAWDGFLIAAAQRGIELPRPKPRFAHGATVAVGPYALLGCYHVSQQNTFTGRLTEAMLDTVMDAAKAAAAITTGPPAVNVSQAERAHRTRGRSGRST